MHHAIYTSVSLSLSEVWLTDLDLLTDGLNGGLKGACPPDSLILHGLHRLEQRGHVGHHDLSASPVTATVQVALVIVTLSVCVCVCVCVCV